MITLDRIYTYRNRCHNALLNAQHNLSALTGYVDLDALRFRRARIVESGSIGAGKYFYLIESIAVDPHNARRAVQWIVFDHRGVMLAGSKAGKYINRQHARVALNRYLDRHELSID